jgi:hypothetical protein
MAVNLISAPDLVSFAENPVLFRFSTSLQDLTFLTIRLCVKATLMVDGEETAANEFTLSIPTSGGQDNIVTFDVSSALNAMFHFYEQSTCYKTASPVRSAGVVAYTVQYWDEYLDEDNAIITGVKTTHYNTLNAIPGGLSDVQRVKWNNNGESWTEHRVLSSKPDGEVIPANFPLVVPLYAFVPQAGGEISIPVVVKKGDEQVESRSVDFFTRAPRWEVFNFSSEGSYTITPSTARPVGVTVVPEQPYATYFEFVNRFGCMESVVCYGRPTLTASCEADRLSRLPSRSLAPSSQFFKRVTSAQQTLSLSTGSLSIDWAMWFSSEFFRAKKVWMYDERLGVMVPVVVEADEDATLFSVTEPGVIDLSFNVILGYDGFSVGAHV